MDRKPSSTSSRTDASPEAARRPPVIDVQALFAGQAEVRLIHRDEEYRLRITKQGKLILTK